MTSMADVVVVGAGPAGSAAAITLARAGREVVLVDKARFPRDKCCGDGLTTGALRRLQALGLQPDAVPSWTRVDDVWISSPAGRVVELALPRGRGTYAAVARRTDLDAALVDLAREAGATVLEGHRMVGARLTAGCAGSRGDAGCTGYRGNAGGRDSGGRDSGSVVVDLVGRDELAARYAIGADGMWSPLRKAMGVAEPGYLGEWHAFRQYFSGVGPAATAGLWVWFEPELLPGYVWSFPLGDNRANVGFGIRRSPGVATGDMGEQWTELLSRPHIREVIGESAQPESAHRAWPIPARVATSPLTAGGGRALFVGDAARATDPMTGEGIAQALETGELAARAILAAGNEAPERAAAIYRRGVRMGLVPDHWMAAACSRGLAHRGGVDAVLRTVRVSDFTRQAFARWMFEDEPRAVLATPWRWRRQMMRQPGAYQSALPVIPRSLNGSAP
ncbi:MAG: hypothetical protein DLM54_11140 [Acidimicrobiales bacterium]|nr:MAG: hypothetical protein DLM54_11140 [Acidimicrobiales bacterium]